MFPEQHPAKLGQIRAQPMRKKQEKCGDQGEKDEAVQGREYRGV